MLPARHRLHERLCECQIHCWAAPDVYICVACSCPWYVVCGLATAQLVLPTPECDSIWMCFEIDVLLILFHICQDVGSGLQLCAVEFIQHAVSTGETGKTIPTLLCSMLASDVILFQSNGPKVAPYVDLDRA